MADNNNKQREAKENLRIAAGDKDSFAGGNTLDDLASITTAELAAEICRRNSGAIVAWFKNIEQPIDQVSLGAVYGGEHGSPSKEQIEELREELGTISMPYPQGLILGGDPKWMALMLAILSENVKRAAKPDMERMFEEQEEGEIRCLIDSDTCDMYAVRTRKNNNRPQH